MTRKDLIKSGWKPSKKYPLDLTRKNMRIALNERNQVLSVYDKKKKFLAIYKIIEGNGTILLIEVFSWQY